ncbi:MAG: UDP-N-acetylglucosamine pyrophosphorylase [Acidobacteriota bacterium]|jgi:UDP-N-acetylglucosamine/UDP-N-acetylgalactosamine diphosphorylase|nr:UDP-N-acetylglucosamine pyrophosphorylase [Acidobacteriota bacterium]
MPDTFQIAPNVRRLLERGVVLPSPCAVEIADSVVPERIASGVVIHAGCRISGAETSIGPGSEIGGEVPATIENCQLGHGVELKGGFFSGATFLDKAAMGSGAQVRPGTLVEEEAGGAHTVGFKQTIFLSFVTAGSLINFCDALMAGGTSRKNHSEIGSSYIHFNFTPNQDKATASLVGDVPRGVFLNQPPIFLGGQGGLVGPARIAYGVLLPAGVICRHDVLEENTLFSPRALASGKSRFVIGAYRDIQRILHNNLLYIGNLWALREWYRRVRIRTMTGEYFRKACHEGALGKIESGIDERVKRLKELAGKMPYSLECARSGNGTLSPDAATVRQAALQQALIDRWPELEERLRQGPDASVGAAAREEFLDAWEKVPSGLSHVEAVRALSSGVSDASGTSGARNVCETGVKWLQALVDDVVALWPEPSEVKGHI